MNTNKRPKIDPKIQIEASIKKPRIENYSEIQTPVWQFNFMDFEGPWSWQIPAATFLEIRDKLSQFESMTWSEIEGPSHHFAEVSNLCKEAQDRLVELKQDDIDHLFSLRLSGRQRVWGIRAGPIFKILWWDPEHIVYPSLKKHT